MNNDTLIQICTNFMAANYKRLSEGERNNMDRIIESFDSTGRLNAGDLAFVNMIYRRAKLDAATRSKETPESHRATSKRSDGQT